MDMWQTLAFIVGAEDGLHGGAERRHNQLCEWLRLRDVHSHRQIRDYLNTTSRYKSPTAEFTSALVATYSMSWSTRTKKYLNLVLQYILWNNITLQKVLKNLFLSTGRAFSRYCRSFDGTADLPQTWVHLKHSRLTHKMYSWTKLVYLLNTCSYLGYWA